MFVSLRVLQMEVFPVEVKFYLDPKK